MTDETHGGTVHTVRESVLDQDEEHDVEVVLDVDEASGNGATFEMADGETVESDSLMDPNMLRRIHKSKIENAKNDQSWQYRMMISEALKWFGQSAQQEIVSRRMGSRMHRIGVGVRDNVGSIRAINDDRIAIIRRSSSLSSWAQNKTPSYRDYMMDKERDRDLSQYHSDIKNAREAVDMVLASPSGSTSPMPENFRDPPVGSVCVAWGGINCIVTNPMYITDSTSRPRTPEYEISIPHEILQEYLIDPMNLYVVDTNVAESLFIDTGDDDLTYYFRGGNEEVSDWRDGYIVELDRPYRKIENVKEHFLKPDRVRAAEQAGRTVRRQGDWFFIEQSDEYMPTGITRAPQIQPDGNDRWLDNHHAEYQGHDALHPDRVLVKGEIQHATNDHMSLFLDDWCEAVNNSVRARSFEVAPYQEQLDFVLTDAQIEGGEQMIQQQRSTRLGYD